MACRERAAHRDERCDAAGSARTGDRDGNRLTSPTVADTAGRPSEGRSFIRWRAPRRPAVVAWGRRAVCARDAAPRARCRLSEV